MKYDYVSLYNKNAAFFNAHPTAKRALQSANFLFTWLFFIAYGVLLTHALFVKPFATEDLVKILFVPGLTLIFVTVLRLFIERPRPYMEEGAGIMPLVEKKKARKHSFPSRHLACAAVIAMTFLPFYPIVSLFLLGASVVLGYLRFAMGWHYPSDVVAGWCLGVFMGYLILLL